MASSTEDEAGSAPGHFNVLVHNVSHADFLLSVAAPSAGESQSSSSPFIKPVFAAYHQTAVAIEQYLVQETSSISAIMAPVSGSADQEVPVGLSLGGEFRCWSRPISASRPAQQSTAPLQPQAPAWGSGKTSSFDTVT